MPALNSCARRPYGSCPSRTHCYNDDDLTTVYDALLASDDRLLALALLSPDGSSRVSKSFLESGQGRALCRRVSMIKGLMLEVGPDWEGSADDVLVPGDPAWCASISGRAWTVSLGRRVALPKSLGLMGRHRCLADILCALAAL